MNVGIGSNACRPRISNIVGDQEVSLDQDSDNGRVGTPRKSTARKVDIL